MNAGGFYFYRTVFAQLNEEWGERLRAIALSAAQGLEELVADEEWSSLGKSELSDLVEPWLEDIHLSTGVRGIFLLSAPDNSWIGGVGLPSGEGIFFADIDIAEISKSWEGESADTEYRKFEGIAYKRAYAPVYDLPGTVRAVVGVEADAGFFYPLVRIRHAMLSLALFSIIALLIAILLVYRMTRMFVRLEETLARTEQALELDQLASSLAHEIRNPLGIIQANAEFLREQIQDPEKQEMVSDLLEEAERLDVMVQSALDRFRGSRGKESFSPFAVVEECVAQFRRGLANTKLEIEMLPRPSGESVEAIVSGERAKSEGAVLNLLRNASEAMPDGGKIVVSLNEGKENIRISIKDNGPGMSPRTVRQIFKPFYSEKEEGVGLGLPAVRRIVEEMGGTVDVKSKLGKGTEFVLTLPKC